MTTVARPEHFMPLALVDSQFATLRQPTPHKHSTYRVDSLSVEITTEIVQQIEQRQDSNGRNGLSIVNSGA
ncbi:MAG: hypothetical protein ABI216_19685 [Devosia sp.]